MSLSVFGVVSNNYIVCYSDIIRYFVNIKTLEILDEITIDSNIYKKYMDT